MQCIKSSSNFDMTGSSDFITWDQIKHYIESGELYKLVRTPEVTAKYRQHKFDVESQGSTLVSYILQHRLRWDADQLQQLNSVTLASDSQKIAALFKDKSSLKILPNDFPYNFEPCVSHILVWSKIYIPLYKSNIDATTDDAVAIESVNPKVKHLIESFLDGLLKPLGLTNYVWFINYPRLQSIKSVSHIHVLINSNDKSPIQRLLTDESLLITLPAQ